MNRRTLKILSAYVGIARQYRGEISPGYLLDTVSKAVPGVTDGEMLQAAAAMKLAARQFNQIAWRMQGTSTRPSTKDLQIAFH